MKTLDLLARMTRRPTIVGRLGRHPEAGRPSFADPQLLAAGKPRHIGVHFLTDALGKPPDRWMRLCHQFFGRNIAQGAVQRLMDARKRVEQDIVRNHEDALRSLRLLLTGPAVKRSARWS